MKAITPEIRAAASDWVRGYERHCEDYWNDLIGDFAGRYGIEIAQAEGLLNEVK